MPLRPETCRTFHRHLYAGWNETVRLLKRGDDQLAGMVTEYTLFDCRWARVFKTGQPIGGKRRYDAALRPGIIAVVLGYRGAILAAALLPAVAATFALLVVPSDTVAKKASTEVRDEARTRGVSTAFFRSFSGQFYLAIFFGFALFAFGERGAAAFPTLRWISWSFRHHIDMTSRNSAMCV